MFVTILAFERKGSLDRNIHKRTAAINENVLKVN